MSVLRLVNGFGKEQDGSESWRLEADQGLKIPAEDEFVTGGDEDVDCLLENILVLCLG